MDILSSVLSTGIAGESLLQELHLQREFYTSHTEGVLVPVQGMAQQSCGSSDVERKALFQGHSEPGCVTKAMAHFRQEKHIFKLFIPASVEVDVSLPTEQPSLQLLVAVNFANAAELCLQIGNILPLTVVL